MKQKLSETTTTECLDAHQCMVCGQDFTSRNRLFKHLRESLCGTSAPPNSSDDNNKDLKQAIPISSLPQPPSTLRKQIRREVYLQQRQQRRSNKTGQTALHVEHACWVGDLPLAWTRQGGNYRRLRALLWILLPKGDVAPPWIKFVQRKAYRCKETETTVADGNRDNSDSSGSYLGYAIVVLRDEQECAILQKLDGREIVTETIFPPTLLEKNSDFSALVAQKVSPFRLKVRPAENKSILENDNIISNTDVPTVQTIPQVDPPLSDQLRPLSTKELLSRATAFGAKTTSNNLLVDETVDSTNTSTDMQHEQALRLALDVYQSGPCRTEIHHNGREIPKEHQDRLLSILVDLRWAVPNHRPGLTAERYLVLPSNVTKDLYYHCLRNACRALMDWVDPQYYYSGIAVTKNFVSSPHRDDRDTTFQYALSLGTFTSGGELCVDEFNEKSQYPVIHVINTHNRIAQVEGRRVHWVRTWEGGDRYSLIFYNTSERNSTSLLEIGV